jgi:hypothetical protein
VLEHEQSLCIGSGAEAFSSIRMSLSLFDHGAYHCYNNYSKLDEPGHISFIEKFVQIL